jgi:hypothetical protein
LFALSQILSGDGRMESSHLVGMLDLPNPSIAEMSFPLLEYKIGKYVIPFTRELIKKNLCKEVQLYSELNPGFDYALWKKD